MAIYLDNLSFRESDDACILSKPTPIPQRLAQARKALGISQKELGIRLGMEPSSASGRMNHYEKGRHTPDYQTLERIAAELGVPISFFTCSSDLTAELYCLIDKLSDDEKQTLIRQIEESIQTKGS